MYTVAELTEIKCSNIHVCCGFGTNTHTHKFLSCILLKGVN